MWRVRFINQSDGSEITQSGLSSMDTAFMFGQTLNAEMFDLKDME